jgi:hypothetical protein
VEAESASLAPHARASLMQFALQAKQRTSRGARRRNIKTLDRRGSFIDLKTVAAALFFAIMRGKKTYCAAPV